MYDNCAGATLNQFYLNGQELSQFSSLFLTFVYAVIAFQFSKRFEKTCQLKKCRVLNRWFWEEHIERFICFLGIWSVFFVTLLAMRLNNPLEDTQ
jgi:NO-binding membrane sensor protein with MHYT domain